MTVANRRVEEPEHSDDDGMEVDNGDASKTLLRWRAAVGAATTPSQLSLCLLRLQSSIAWEKSIMKVVSQGT